MPVQLLLPRCQSAPACIFRPEQRGKRVNYNYPDIVLCYLVLRSLCIKHLVVRRISTGNMYVLQNLFVQANLLCHLYNPFRPEGMFRINVKRVLPKTAFLNRELHIHCTLHRNLRLP